MWRRYLRFWRNDVEGDVDDELRFHADMRVAEYMTRGMTDEEARRAVGERLGDVEAARAECVTLGEARERQSRQADFLDGLRADLHYALRSYARAPGWTAVALLTIALGIGVTTAVFRVADTLLLRPIAYPDASRVFVFRRLYTVPGRQLSAPFAMAGVRAWRESARSIETAVPFLERDSWMRTSGTDSVPVRVAAVDSGFLQLAGARPVIGRDFTAAERVPNGPHVVLLSESLWRRVFGASTDILGKVVDFGGTSATIVGVVPAALGVPEFRSGLPELWKPYDDDITNSVAVRLRPGVSREAATRELTAILSRSVTDPPWWRDIKMHAALTRPQDLLPFRQGLMMLTGAVALLLLVACTNVTHLLLARGAARQRELAVRFALGAGRWRLVRQLVTETLVIAIGGGALAVLVAAAGLRALEALRPEAMDAFAYVSADHGIVSLAGMLAIGAGLGVGVASALWNAQRELGVALRATTAGSSLGGRRLRGALLVGEIAFSATLLVGALLLIHALVDLERKQLGFDAEGMYTLTFRLKGGTSPAERIAIGRVMRQRVAAMPGVERVALGSSDFMLMAAFATRDGEAPTSGQVVTGLSDVDRDYFTVMRMPLIAGHTFDEGSASRHEVIVSRSLAQHIWGGADPIGRQFRNARPIDAAKEWMTVIGVVPDVVSNLLNVDPQAQIYEPVESAAKSLQLTLVVRMHNGSGSQTAALERAAAAVYPGSAPPKIVNMREEIDRSAAEPRFTMRIMVAFAIFAVLLAAIGLFGVISYTVGQRTREIGVRMTLGATRGSIAGLVIGDGIRLTLWGIALGLIGALAATRLIQAAQYGVSRLDPFSYIVGAAMLVLVAVLACLVPMLRATSVDPVIAVRSE